MPKQTAVSRCADPEECSFSVDGLHIPCTCGHLSGQHVGGHPHPCDHTGKDGRWTCSGEKCEEFTPAPSRQTVTARCGDACLAGEVCRNCGNCGAPHVEWKGCCTCGPHYLGVPL